MTTPDQTQVTNAIADGMGKVQAMLARKALSDSAFRQRLVADPRAGLAEVAGQALPSGLVVHVHENAPAMLHVVLPPILAPSVVLDDEQLEAVAGGFTPVAYPLSALSIIYTVELTRKL